MRPFGFFVNGKLVKTYQSRKKVTEVFVKACAFANNEEIDLCVTEIGKGVILEN